MTVRIRSAGPMTLTNYTVQEIAQLRQAVSSPMSKIKYLALGFHKTDKTVQVVAQANDKLSIQAWREYLGHRLRVTQGNPQASIELIKKGSATFEEYGRFGRPSDQQKKHTSIQEPTDITTEDEDEAPKQPVQPVPKLILRVRRVYLKRLEMHRREDLTKRDHPAPTGIKPEDVTMFSKNKKKHQLKTRVQVLHSARTAFLKRMCVHELEHLLAGYYSICHHYFPFLRGSPYERPFVCRRLKRPQ